MKVSRAQVEENRARIIKVASELFREKGYDGVSVADLMAAAGLTHGGFYKHFSSKTELMFETAICGLKQIAEQTRRIDRTEFIRNYISRQHRDSPGSGCTIAALSCDAARHGSDMGKVFASGIETLLHALSSELSEKETKIANQERAALISMIAQSVGAIILSRACPGDSELADEILNVCRDNTLKLL